MRLNVVLNIGAAVLLLLALVFQVMSLRATSRLTTTVEENGDGTFEINGPSPGAALDATRIIRTATASGLVTSTAAGLLGILGAIL